MKEDITYNIYLNNPKWSYGGIVHLETDDFTIAKQKFNEYIEKVKEQNQRERTSYKLYKDVTKHYEIDEFII